MYAKIRCGNFFLLKKGNIFVKYLICHICLLQAGMKIVQLYLEGYRQDWGLSFKKDTVTRGGW